MIDMLQRNTRHLKTTTSFRSSLSLLIITSFTFCFPVLKMSTWTHKQASWNEILKFWVQTVSIYKFGFRLLNTNTSMFWNEIRVILNSSNKLGLFQQKNYKNRYQGKLIGWRNQRQRPDVEISLRPDIGSMLCISPLVTSSYSSLLFVRMANN